MITDKFFDWNEYQAKAQRMTTGELFAAIRDIRATLDEADAMDRAMGTDNGGYYRDESSVYQAELRRREGMSRECWVRYRTAQWEDFTVEGWITDSVDNNGLAHMVKVNENV